jgi:glycosyltransferase involved in cell wall biosynthesis
MFPKVPTTLPEGTTNIVAIHHNFEDNFAELTRPPNVDVFIAFRTWDFGLFPKTWADVIESEFDQLWVYSHWVRENAIQSNIPEEKIKVVPLGVTDDPIQPQKLPNEFTFLFIGATVYRKGIDILLDAYSKAFTNQDNVKLIIKDNPSDVFYKDISYEEKILEFQKKQSNPKIHYVNEYLDIEELTKLIQKSDVGVFPYRSEGFARPILELMNLGIPSIVPDFGPCKDYCNNETSFFVSGKHFSLPYEEEVAYNTLGYTAKINGLEFYEISPDVLSKKMQEVTKTEKETISNKGKAGQIITSQGFTWPKIIEDIENILEQSFGSSNGPP